MCSLSLFLQGVSLVVKSIYRLWQDERGLITAELVIGILLLVGAAAAVGYGMSAALRGLAGSVIQTIKDADPNP